MSRRCFWTLLLVLLLPGHVEAQESNRPCQVNRTVVETPRQMLLLCDESQAVLPTNAEIFEVREALPGDPRVTLDRIGDASIEGIPAANSRWKRITILPPARSLSPGRRYFVYIAPTVGPAPASGTWKPFWNEVTTEFEATIVDSPRSIDSGQVLQLSAGVAIRSVPAPTLTLTKDGQLHPLPATFAVSQPATATVATDPALVGRVTITLTDQRLPVGEIKLTVSGLEDVFGVPLNTAPKARTEVLGQKLSGLSKDEVGTYIKFGHEAARNVKPTFTLDAKLTIELPQRLGGWRVTPTATADIGVGPSKSSNTVNLGVALTRFDLVHPDFGNPRQSDEAPAKRALQGLRASVTPTLEADRDFVAKNVLADLDAELFWRGLYNPIRKQNRLRLKSARVAAGNPRLQMDEIRSAAFGWAVTTNVGLEVGRALEAQKETFETGEGENAAETTVVAEAHLVARVRSRLGILLEFKRASLNIQATGRWLASEEQALIESNDTFSLQTFDGWHGYGEVTLSIPLGPRTAIDSTWKNGRPPPLFQRINAVQTGFAFRF